jgi:hypothetical protein
MPISLSMFYGSAYCCLSLLSIDGTIQLWECIANFRKTEILSQNALVIEQLAKVDTLIKQERLPPIKIKYCMKEPPFR